ncbi:LysR family transcriptional regulator [Tropicibacter sp. R16_0]|uniref:LysR substrate-binding domain-containing protein n=1 Tax=Tropicibacter sp. R16_0 TaxID=2821102 RepID=UPI001ADC1984|nr:LysR substrate-binding domain-containing protein [Tropicibacter sp. R16_0]MBO9449057.1 LysR family transcriptional regulator [Tropicibacter sp. R16_0]
MRRALRNKLDQLRPGALSKLEPVGFDSNRMRRTLPPLQTLIAFETAARLQSFTLAAAELNLTQPAVSQQVKLLEHRLGIKLFRRRNNMILLTEQGEQFAEDVTEMLNTLGESVQNLAPDAGRTTLTVSLLPSFASTWFASRAHRFVAANPSVDLLTLSTVAKTGFGQEDADVAIRWGPGGYTDGYEEHLFGEQHMLVASAQTAGMLGDVSDINALSDRPFLHDTNYSEWRAVIELNGGDPTAFEHGAYFGDSSATVNAILYSQGIGVVRDVIARHLLASGALVQLPFEPVKGPYSYFFICPERRVDQPRVQSFLSWLRQEAQTP